MKLTSSTYPERKLYILQELETYLRESYINQIPSWPDYESDSSTLKFVSREKWYNNEYYIPADLTMLFPNKSLTLAVSEEISYMMISERALPWLQELAFAYDDEFWKPLKVNSVWRSFEFQRDWFSQACRDSWLCAEPGFSEHQSWLAVDISGMYGEFYEWMKRVAHTYGFHQSYQKWFEIDGYNEEKWHWRFVGVEFATELVERDLTFTEWMELQEESETWL